MARYKDMIPYIVFGVLTTLVNMVAYWLLAHLLKCGVMPSTIMAWILAVLFAYFTNRQWFFHSEAHTIHETAREIVSFFLCRMATGIVDWGGMLFFAGCIHWNDVLVKFVMNVVVIILNYVASKWIIFKHRKE